MEKEILEQLIELNKSQRQIAEELNCSQGTVKHWLRKYSLKTIVLTKIPATYTNKTEKLCARCKETKFIKEFYWSKSKSNPSIYCKVCHNVQTRERQKLLKIKAVEYKGGKCESCEYDKYIGALEFHHKDPKKKDFAISKALSLKFANVVKELDKCLLLCANCHREIHAAVV